VDLIPHGHHHNHVPGYGPSVSISGSSVADDPLDIYGVPLKVPWVTLKVLAAVWLVYGALFVTTQVAVGQCSFEYFAIFVASYLPLAGTIVWGTRYIATRQREDHLSILEGDLNFNFLSYVPAGAAFVIGTLCALLGIGGGELMGPLLLHYGILPQVSTATTSLMSFLNTASNILHYCINGDVHYPRAGCMFAIGVAGGMSGRITALTISQKFGRYSLLIFLLCGVLLVSFGLITYHIASDDRDFSLHQYC
jgi:hypothetical protein